MAFHFNSVSKKVYHFRPALQPIQIIRPSLHHLAPLRQVLSEVVGRAHGVALGVRELALDSLMVPALFVQQGGRHAAEAVPVISSL